MKNLRQLHLYLGCLFAPLLIYFSLSGAWQVFRFNDIPKEGPPPSALNSALHELSKPHTHSTLPGASPKTAESEAFNWLVLAMAVGLMVTTVMGLIIALSYGRLRKTVWLSIGMGTLLPIVLLLLASWARADSDSISNEESSTPPNVTAHGKRGGGKHAKSSQSSRGSQSRVLKGVCNVVASALNPLAGPCVNTLVILNDSDGNEVSKDRTTSQGQFEFAVEPGKAYRLVSGSKSYEVVAPLAVVHGGDQAELQLRLK